MNMINIGSFNQEFWLDNKTEYVPAVYTLYQDTKSLNFTVIAKKSIFMILFSFKMLNCNYIM